MTFQCVFHVLWSKCFPLGCNKVLKHQCTKFVLPFCGDEATQNHPSTVSNQCFWIWELRQKLVCTGTSDNTGTNSEDAPSSAEPGEEPSDYFQPIFAKKMYCTVMKICEADTPFIELIACSQVLFRNS